MAYGAGGADNSIKPEDVYDAIQDVIGPDNKIKQEWDKDAPIGLNQETFERPTGFAKILIGALFLAIDSLPKGGTLEVTHDGDSDFTVVARGENATFRDGTHPALALKTTADSLEPKNVHPYIMGLVRDQYGFGIELSILDDESVAITVTL